MLLEAGPPEILRAVQRDDAFKKHFLDDFSEILQALFGVNFYIRFKELWERTCNALYQVITTMSGIQTLGEEYTGMVQVNYAKNSLPEKHCQLLMIILNTFGDKVLADALQKLEKTIEQLPEEHPLKHSARIKIIQGSNIFKTCIPFFYKFHKVLFYFNGHYYELSKRLCGIKYVLVRYWLKDRTSLPAFKLLGFITLIQSILSLLFTVFNFSKLSEEKTYDTKLTAVTNMCDKCSLCLNARQHTSVTPCGHLFCWACIIHWLQEQPKCPLCRQIFQPSRVVFLQNYNN